MNKTYLIKHKDLLKVLNRLQSFKSTFDLFSTSNDNYEFSIKIEKLDDIWECKINIKNEREENKVLERTSSSFEVL